MVKIRKIYHNCCSHSERRVTRHNVWTSRFFQPWTQILNGSSENLLFKAITRANSKFRRRMSRVKAKVRRWAKLILPGRVFIGNMQSKHESTNWLRSKVKLEFFYVVAMGTKFLLQHWNTILGIIYWWSTCKDF